MEHIAFGSHKRYTLASFSLGSRLAGGRGGCRELALDRG